MNGNQLPVPMNSARLSPSNILYKGNFQLKPSRPVPPPITPIPRHVPSVPPPFLSSPPQTPAFHRTTTPLYMTKPDLNTYRSPQYDSLSSPRSYKISDPKSPPKHSPSTTVDPYESLPDLNTNRGFQSQSITARKVKIKNQNSVEESKQPLKTSRTVFPLLPESSPLSTSSSKQKQKNQGRLKVVRLKYAEKVLFGSDVMKKIDSLIKGK
ncbi:hypothetical protein RCL1_007433 [Eukaryota sp. TZLM3-RCL]